MKKISYQAIEKRDDECGPYEWVNPSNITGFDLQIGFNFNKNRYIDLKYVQLNISDDELFTFDYGLTISSYLGECIREKLNNKNIKYNFTSIDVINAAIFLIIDLGSYSPVLTLQSYLTQEHVIECLSSLQKVYEELSPDDFRHEFMRDYILELFHLSYPHTGLALFYEELTSEQQIFLNSITPEKKNYDLSPICSEE